MCHRARRRARARAPEPAQRSASRHPTHGGEVKTRTSVPSLFRCWTFVARLCHGRYATAGPHTDGETLMRVLRSGLVLGAFILAFLLPAAPASAEPLHD